MLFNTRFDLIVSLGEDCACSSYLRKFALQNASYPFDWLTKASLKTRVDLINDDFHGFLKRENMYQIPHPEDSEKNCDYYEDRNTDFYFYHDFPMGVDLDDSFAVVREKYNRRIQRLYQTIESAHRVLFVWWSRDKHHTPQEIESYYAILSKKFNNCDVFMLAMEFAQNKSIAYYHNNHILIINDKIVDDINITMGDAKINNKYFAKIKKKRTLHERTSYALYKTLKFLSCLIFVRSVRHRFKDYIKMKLLHAKL